MTEQPGSGNDVLEWIGIGVAASGALLAWIRAGKTNQIAASSSETAKSALNEAKRANRTSESANQIAEESAAAAKDAVEQAKRSADIAERVEGRQTERSHVSWDIFKAKAIGYWRVDNVGTDIAYEAYVAFCVNDEWEYSDRKDIAPGDHIDFEFREKQRAEEDRVRAEQKSLAAVGITYGAKPKIKIKYEIHWRTESGVWKSKTSEDQNG